MKLLIYNVNIQYSQLYAFKHNVIGQIDSLALHSLFNEQLFCSVICNFLICHAGCLVPPGI